MQRPSIVFLLLTFSATGALAQSASTVRRADTVTTAPVTITVEDAAPSAADKSLAATAPAAKSTTAPPPPAPPSQKATNKSQKTPNKAQSDETDPATAEQAAKKEKVH